VTSASLQILIIIEAEIATTHLIEQVMNACRRYGVQHRMQLLHQLSAEEFLPGTVPLFVRCGDPLMLNWVATLRRAGWPYAYYIDDNFWRISGSTAVAAYYGNPIVRRSLEHDV
jgi:hypothetical protein